MPENKLSKKDNDNGLDPDSFIKEFISISSNQKEIKPGSTKAILEEERKQLTLKARKNIEYNRIPKVKSEKDRISDLRKKQKNERRGRKAHPPPFEKIDYFMFSAYQVL